MDQKTEIETNPKPDSLLDQPLGKTRINRHIAFLNNRVVLSSLFALSMALGYAGASVTKNQFFPAHVSASVVDYVKPETVLEETPKQPANIEEKFFKNFSIEDKVITEQETAKQIKLYNDPLRAERVLDWEKTTIKPILDLDVPPKDHQFWSEFLSAIVYVESEGQPLALSDAGITGLAQISDATAKDTARKHGITNFNLKNGWDSLRLSRFHLQDLIERYGPDISLIAYYGGMGFADQIVLTALEKRGIPKDDSILKRGISSNQQLFSYIDHYQINIANLGSEDGKEYLKKIIAALRILREARGKVNSVQTTN